MYLVAVVLLGIASWQVSTVAGNAAGWALYAGGVSVYCFALCVVDYAQRKR